jgi:hypothetical protein
MSVLTPTVCGLGGWRAVSQIPSEILAEIQARSASRTAQTSQAPPPAEMTTILNPDQSEAGGAGGSVPPCAAVAPVMCVPVRVFVCVCVCCVFVSVCVFVCVLILLRLLALLLHLDVCVCVCVNCGFAVEWRGAESSADSLSLARALFSRSLLSLSLHTQVIDSSVACVCSSLSLSLSLSLSPHTQVSSSRAASSAKSDAPLSPRAGLGAFGSEAGGGVPPSTQHDATGDVRSELDKILSVCYTHTHTHTHTCMYSCMYI